MGFEGWDKYLKWNDLLAGHFFFEEMAGREVLLFVDDQLIEGLGREIGQNKEGFIQAIKQGPYWVTIEKQGICQKALRAYENWRCRGLSYPPYIAYLALFVLAEGIEGSFSPIAYYPRLRALLSEPPSGSMYPSFDKMSELWNDLEIWTKEDKNEELGRFTSTVRGGWIHVGIPLSQTVLSGEERKKLPLIFKDADLDPSDRPSAEEIKKALLSHGPGRLAKRTFGLLNGSYKNDILKDFLLNFIFSELEEWDGSVSEDPSCSGGLSNGYANSNIRICIDLTSIGEIKTTLRICTGRPLPEDGLSLKPLSWTCKQSIKGWSTPLRHNESGKIVNAATVDWDSGVQLVDDDNNWAARLKGSLVRLFVLGDRFGLSNWVEATYLERNCEFLLLCDEKLGGAIQRWGESSCDSFKEILYPGIPKRWRLFEGKNAQESFKGFGVLTLSSFLRLVFDGGIKISKGNSYLYFAPPSIVLENSAGEEMVLVNGQEIPRVGKNIPSWELPKDAPLDTPLNIKVISSSGECLIHRSIRLESIKTTPSYGNLPKRNMLGHPFQLWEGEPYVAGAIASDVSVCGAGFPRPFPTYLSSRIIFLGSKPGEVVDWPGESLEVEWQPVWALAKVGRDKWAVHFCGDELHLSSAHMPGEPISDIRAVREWAKNIWIKRKRTDLPKVKILKGVWSRYMEVAKNVR